MNSIVRTYLIERTRLRSNQTIGYQELADQCKLNLDMNSEWGRSEIGRILGEVSEFEFKAGRPLLSSLVILKNGDGGAGDGLYRLGEQLGFGPAKRLKENMFEAQQLRLCLDFWRDDSNYQKHR